MTEKEEIANVIVQALGELEQIPVELSEKAHTTMMKALSLVKNITYEPLLATVCKYNNGNWCKFKGKCPHRTRVYTAPDEDGNQSPTNSYMCYQGHMLNGC